MASSRNSSDLSRRVSIRAKLLQLVLVIALPLGALDAWSIYATAQSESRHAQEQVRALAEITASETAKFLGQAQNILKGLALRPAVRALDSSRCDPLLAEFASLAPRFSNVLTMTLDGRVVCSAVPQARPVRMDTSKLLDLLRSPDQMTVGKATPGTITGHWAMPLGLALPDGQGGIAGAVGLAVDLFRFPVLPSIEGMPSNTVVSIIAADGTVLARSKDAQQFVGTDQSGHAGTHALLATQRGTAEQLGLDGILRIRGFTPIAGTDWIAVASVPSSEVFAGVRARIATDAWLASAILGATMLLAIRLSGDIRAPIKTLADAVDQVAGGNLSARAPVAGAAEIATVATGFNAMLDALARSDLERGRLQQIIEQTSDQIGIAGLDGVLIYINRAGRAAVGLRPEDSLAGLNTQMVYSPERWKFMLEVARPHAAKHGFWADESFLRRPDGSEFAVSQVLVALKNVRGEVDCFAGISRDISQIRRAEAELRESERQFRSLAAASPVGIYRTDRKGAVTYVNARWCEISGASASEAMDQGWFKTVLTDRERVLAEIREGAKGRGRFESEFRFERPDGSVAWVLANAVPEFDTTGKFLGHVGTVIDITGRRQAEDALREAEARLRLAVAASNIGLWDWNLLTNEVYFSREWKGQIGYAEDEIANRFDEWQSRLHPDDLATTLAKVQRFIEDPARGYAVEFRLRHKDGSWRWIFTQAQILVDASGQPARMIGCHLDITQRKQDEQTLRASEAKLRKLIDGLGNHMFVGLLTPEGVLLEANNPALAAAGLTLQDVLGRPVDQTYWFAHSEPVQQRLRTAIRLAAAGTSSRYDVQIQVAEKQLIWIDLSIHPLLGEAGAVQYLIPSAIVITERKQAEQALRESAASLEVLNNRLLEVQEDERRAIARELHDGVGQNLAVLNLNLGILGTRLAPGTPNGLLERFDDARKLIETTSQQVRNVMADLRPPALDDFGLQAALRSYATTFSKRVGIAVSMAGEDLDPRPVPAAEITLFRIAQEALTNAAKHARARQITVTLAATTHLVSLSIADDGVGFDAAQAAAKQLHWGLATMRERAEGIGATLRIESVPGRGTRITVEVARGKA